MDYILFQSSAQRPSDIHQLYLRRGWNGAGCESQLLVGKVVAVWLTPETNQSDLCVDEFAVVILGTPTRDEVVERLRVALRDLHDRCGSYSAPLD